MAARIGDVPSYTTRIMTSYVSVDGLVLARQSLFRLDMIVLVWGVP